MDAGYRHRLESDGLVVVAEAADGIAAIEQAEETLLWAPIGCRV